MKLLRGRNETQCRRRFWLTEDEVILYGLADHPDRFSSYLSLNAWQGVVRLPFADPAWAPLLDNKWFFARSFSAMGLAVPRSFGLLHPQGGFTMAGQPLSDRHDLENWIHAEQVSSFVVKPVCGLASKGIVIVTNIQAGPHGLTLSLGDGAIADLDAVVAHLSTVRGVLGHVVEEYLRPREDLARIGFQYPYSIRIVTMMDENHVPGLVMAVAYVGRQCDMANTWATGALSLHIDLDTGVLGRGRTVPTHGLDWHTQHPDNQAVFAGETLPDWQMVRELCLRAARAAVGCRIVCWEVMLTEAGPYLIEGNLNFGLSMFQVHTRGLVDHEFGRRLRELGADFPDPSGEWYRRHRQSIVVRGTKKLSRGVARISRRPASG